MESLSKLQIWSIVLNAIGGALVTIGTTIGAVSANNNGTINENNDQN